MKLKFNKYQATGNDFVIVDNRLKSFPKDDQEVIARICDRKFGVGADGLILVETSDQANFTMIYFNADGELGSFCGNGSRAATKFAQTIGLIDKSGSLLAYDGLHSVEIEQDLIKIQMKEVQYGRKVLDGTFIDTGSPHYVELSDNVGTIDVFTKGKDLRHNEEFKPKGTNVNFVEKISTTKIKVRTFERGVEDETLSCGTGVTASALSSSDNPGRKTIEVNTLGGNLTVSFENSGAGYKNIWLIGPAEMTFTGTIQL